MVYRREDGCLVIPQHLVPGIAGALTAAVASLEKQIKDEMYQSLRPMMRSMKDAAEEVLTELDKEN